MKKVEEWREIKDYPNYEVSSLGRVRSKDRIVGQFGHKKNYTRIMKGKDKEATEKVLRVYQPKLF